MKVVSCFMAVMYCTIYINTVSDRFKIYGFCRLNTAKNKRAAPPCVYSWIGCALRVTG